MAIQGRVIYVGQIQTGVSKNSGKTWRKQEYAIETQGQYPKKVAFSVMNDKIEQFNIQMGLTIDIDVDAQSREYNGKWYTELTAWRVNNLGMTNQPQNNNPVAQQQAPQGYQSTDPFASAPQQGGYSQQDVAF